MTLATFPKHRAVFLILLIGLISGCQSAHYMGQAISGHLDLLDKRQPVEDLIDDPQTPDKLRRQLVLTTQLLEFAEEELRLPAGGQYRSYVNLERPYVVWNVFAAPELSLEPKTWCYPVVGCTVYRGYYSEEDARRYAQKLTDRGYDVMVGGVTAYSTLGWFSDPLLSTFIDHSESGLAALIFHELAHQLIYLPDDSPFNESFATAVSHEGLRRWHLSRNNMDKYQRFSEFYHDRQKVLTLIAGYRNRLRHLYQSSLSDSIKRRQKAGLLQEMRQEFESLSRQKASLTVFSHWFESPLNNARLISISTYNEYVPAFQQILQDSQYDLELFYQHCKRLADYSPSKRREALQELVHGKPPHAVSSNR